MTKRQTQLFAVFLLIGAPLIVSLLSGYFMPALREIVPVSQQPGPPAYMQPAPDPAAGLPPGQAEPPPSATSQTGPQAGGNYTPVPALDPNGLAISGTDPTPLSAAPGDGSAPAQGGSEPRALTVDEQHTMNDVR